MNHLNSGRKQSQTFAANSGWLHQRPPQTIQSQYHITMLGPTNNNAAYFLFQQVSSARYHPLYSTFIWLYQDSKEPRQYLSARKSIMQINKTNSSSLPSNSTSWTFKYTWRKYSIRRIVLWCRGLGLSHHACCCQVSQILEESITLERRVQPEQRWSGKMKSNIEKINPNPILVRVRAQSKISGHQTATSHVIRSLLLSHVQHLCSLWGAEGASESRVKADSIMTTITKWLLTRKWNLLGYIIEIEAISCHQANSWLQK